MDAVNAPRAPWFRIAAECRWEALRHLPHLDDEARALVLAHLVVLDAAILILRRERERERAA